MDQSIFQMVIQGQKASLRNAFVPMPKFIPFLKANLMLSQYREHVQDYMEDLSTFLAYPIFDSFQQDQRKVVGILATNVYWKILFSGLLPSNINGIVCVIQNSYNQTFAYQIDGPEATFLSMGDPRDPKEASRRSNSMSMIICRVGPVPSIRPTPPSP
jgi:hypothetical protein